jgi:hypothetical protein
MAMLWLVTLILVSGFAIASGHGMKWKLFNVLIILGCMGLGYCLGYAAGLGSKNMGMVPNAALPFTMMFGIVGALMLVEEIIGIRSELSYYLRF